MTDFWESLSRKVEAEEGRAVVDASIAAGVQHLIFLVARQRLQIEQWSSTQHRSFRLQGRDRGGHDSPSTLVPPGMSMSVSFDIIRKDGQGGYNLALPVSEDRAQIPLLDAAGDTGR